MKRHYPFSSSFRAQFNVTVAAVYLVATVATLVAFTLAIQALLADFAAQITVKEVLLQRNKVAAVVDRELALAQTLAADPTVRRWVENESDPGLKSLAFEQLENYRQAFRDHSFFVAIEASRDYYLDNRAHGAQTVVGTHLNPSNPADQWFFRALRSERGYELNLDHDILANDTKVWINAVIRDDKGQVIGLGGSGLDITDFINGLVTSKEKGLTTLLTDQNGVVTASENSAMVEQNARTTDPAARTTVYSLINDPEARERLRRAIATSSDDDAQVAVFPVSLALGKAMVAVSVLPGTGWRNVVIFDVSSLMSSQVYLPELVIILCSLLLVLAAITVFTNRRVLRPLVALTQAARQMAHGRYDVALPVGRVDEVGQLADSFNAMAATVLDHTRNLERKVAERTSELSVANAELFQSRATMLESLRYARAIQATLLPRAEDLALAFCDAAILYEPRDLVGGDLILLRQSADYVLFGVVDCTGHGVPGAFMSMTAHSLLHRAASELPPDDPAAILSETDRLLRQTYRLDATKPGTVDCGLEAALCCHKKGSRRLVFAGAHLPLFLVQAGTVRQVRGDRQRVGYRGPAAKAVFFNKDIEIGPETSVFATTDGVFDESGGERGFGFGVDRFLDILASEDGKPLSATTEALHTALRTYRGGRPQRDDIAVIGGRL